MTNPFDTIMARWLQTVERAEVLDFDEVSYLEAFETFQQLEALRAELDTFEVAVRAEMHRRVVAAQIN